MLVSYIKLLAIGMISKRNFNIVLVDSNNPKPLDYDADGIVIEYNGSAISMEL